MMNVLKPKYYKYVPGANDQDKLFKDLQEVLVNDNNKKPPHINQNVKNTEFWVKRGKKECTLVLGESWTYGESLEGRVQSALMRWDLDTQIRYCWGPQVATLLDTDYYQYAIPGNNNFYIFGNVERLLKYLSPQYDKIYLLVQMTEPSREDIVINELGDHPLTRLYDRNYISGMSIKDWCVENEHIFYTQLNDTIAKFNNVKATAWKNFCTQQNENYWGFTMIKETWMEFSARMTGFKLQSPDFYVAAWLKNFVSDYPVVKKMKYLNKQLDMIEASNNFLQQSQDHCPHPVAAAHKVWGYNVYTLMDK